MAAFLLHWMIAFGLMLAFMTYEVVQMVVFVLDKWKIGYPNLMSAFREYLHDRAYPEIAGMMIGIGIGCVAIWLLNYFGVNMYMLWR